MFWLNMGNFMRRKIAFAFAFIPIIFLPLWHRKIIDTNILSLDALFLLIPLISIVIFYTVVFVLKIFKID